MDFARKKAKIFSRKIALPVLLAVFVAGMCVSVSNSQSQSSTAKKKTPSLSGAPKSAGQKFSAQKSTTQKSTAANSGAHKSSSPQKSAAKSSTGKSTTGKSSGRKGKSSARSRRQPGQKAPTTDRVSEIQTALAKDGSFSGTPNGKWDDSTVDAMKKFQVGHGLNPTGRLDAPTLQKLGLGSTTAGVAAPQAPPGAVSRLTSSRFKSAEPASEDQQ